MENDNYLIHKITSETKILVENNPTERYSQEIQNEIDHFWQSKIDSGVFLFDGKLFNVTHISEDIIRGHFIHYRTFLAWRYSPLREAFTLKPLSLSCMTFAGNHILVGKRAVHMAQYPNLLEFAPSGGVDSECEYDGEINYKELTQRELLEETGLTSDNISTIQLITAIEDIKEGTLELCVKITLQENTDIIHPPQDEYSELHWLNAEQIEQSFSHTPQLWLPFSFAFWKNITLNKKK
ncbi:MAG: NUDIX hydrolase [Parachlamydiales bacterium]|jgi:8-oxo-dGTP pyrophosphatase MutT (NUDIX family)